MFVGEAEHLVGGQGVPVVDDAGGSSSHSVERVGVDGGGRSEWSTVDDDLPDDWSGSVDYLHKELRNSWVAGYHLLSDGDLTRKAVSSWITDTAGCVVNLVGSWWSSISTRSLIAHVLEAKVPAKGTTKVPGPWLRWRKWPLLVNGAEK